jgi:XRE family transcriptional regulator, aerobic/anaerobic benzoate catabolism transcriptional regulator
VTDPSVSGKPPLLVGLGRAIREQRTGHVLTIRELAERAHVSARFLVQLEGGSGNISVARLEGVAKALGISLSALFKEAEAARPSEELPASQRARVISLLGLRGAGKSSIGAELARQLGLPFVELDQLIAREAGMALSTIFEMHGEAYFERLEEQTLRRFLDAGSSAVLATGGSLVTHAVSYRLLRDRTFTVWLKAKPQEHWDRVVAQGDARPMSGRPAAMNELRRLLKERTPLYSQADFVIETSHFTAARAAATIAETSVRFLEKKA